jgi:serine/threonine-protein kinase
VGHGGASKSDEKTWVLWMIGVGQRIGKYRIVRKIGQGGMGAVFEAVHEEIGRRAAIKVLLPEFTTDPQNIARFFNEARAVNIIQHPGLVGMFESGRMEDGSAYIVMEFLEGELLSNRLIKANKLSLKSALTLCRQIASALAAAHMKRIVHRDLKPENIMLVPDPETADGERVKVFDFGIAKLRVDSLGPGRGPSLTQTGMIMGTPTHMAPEQCRGETDISGKADVYALGVVLYQALAGHPPFMAPSTGELLSMHLRDKPTRLRRIDPALPDMVEDLVARMLEKEPGDRPEMSEVVIELEALGAHPTRSSTTPMGVPILVPPKASDKVRLRGGAPGTLQAATGQTYSSRTSRQFRLAIVVAVVLVLIAGGVLLWPASEPSEVVWSVDSDPPGAEIARVDNGDPVATTPWRAAQKRREGTLTARIRKRGYYDRIVTLNYRDSVTLTVPLERMPQPDMAAPPADLAPQRFVHWAIGSRPEKAEVYDAETNELLGKTPVDLKRLAATGTKEFILRRPGCEDQNVFIDRAKDFSVKPTLTCKKSGSPRTEVPMVNPDEEQPLAPVR